MQSVLRSVKKRKKSRCLGEPEIVNRGEYGELELDARVELIRALVRIGLMHVGELLDHEVTELAGARYCRKDPSVTGRRHGSNPGSVRLAGQSVPIRVPRVRSESGGEIPLRSYEAMRSQGDINDVLLRRVLYGVSCRNYEAAAESVPGQSDSQARPCRATSSRRVPLHCGNSRNVTCRTPTWSRCSSTARHSPT